MSDDETTNVPNDTTIQSQSSGQNEELSLEIRAKGDVIETCGNEHMDQNPVECVDDREVSSHTDDVQIEDNGLVQEDSRCEDGAKSENGAFVNSVMNEDVSISYQSDARNQSSDVVNDSINDNELTGQNTTSNLINSNEDVCLNLKPAENHWLQFSNSSDANPDNVESNFDAFESHAVINEPENALCTTQIKPCLDAGCLDATDNIVKEHENRSTSDITKDTTEIDATEVTESIDISSPSRNSLSEISSPREQKTEEIEKTECCDEADLSFQVSSQVDSNSAITFIGPDASQVPNTGAVEWADFGDSAFGNQESTNCFGEPTTAAVAEFADFANFASFTAQQHEIFSATTEAQEENSTSELPKSDSFDEDFDDFADFSTQPVSTEGTFHDPFVSSQQAPETYGHCNGFVDDTTSNSFSDNTYNSGSNLNINDFNDNVYASFDDFVDSVDLKCDAFLTKEPLVTEEPLLIQDFFVSISINSPISKQVTEEVESVWGLMGDMTNSSSLVLNVQSSILNSQLLSSLGVDLNNTLSSVKHNLPKYAAQLGLLQPMKSGDLQSQHQNDDHTLNLSTSQVCPTSSSSLSLSAKNSSSTLASYSSSSRNASSSNLPNMSCQSPTPDAVPEVEFDWGTSGLKNPLEMQSLSLDFFDSQFNSSSAASATSKLEAEFIDGIGDNLNQGSGGDTNSVGSTSGVSRDSKLASILAAAQNSSHENIDRKKANELSPEAQEVVRKLPTLSFMLSRVLMFPFLGDSSQRSNRGSLDEASVNSLSTPRSPRNSYTAAPQEDNDQVLDTQLDEDDDDESDEPFQELEEASLKHTEAGDLVNSPLEVETIGNDSNINSSDKVVQSDYVEIVLSDVRENEVDCSKEIDIAGVKKDCEHVEVGISNEDGDTVGKKIAIESIQDSSRPFSQTADNNKDESVSVVGATTDSCKDSHDVISVLPNDPSDNNTLSRGSCSNIEVEDDDEFGDFGDISSN